MNTKQEQAREQLHALRRELAGDGAELHFEDAALGVQVFRKPSAVKAGYVALLGFIGRCAKPNFHYRFGSIEAGDRFVADWLHGPQERAAIKQARKAKAAEGHWLKIGDVLVSSWGYEQTNYDYYEVIRLVGRQSVEVRELHKSRTETQWLQGECVPVKGRYKGEPMVKRVTNGDSVKVRDWGVWARKKECRVVDGVELFAPDSYTAYG